MFIVLPTSNDIIGFKVLSEWARLIFKFVHTALSDMGRKTEKSLSRNQYFQSRLFIWQISTVQLTCLFAFQHTFVGTS